MAATAAVVGPPPGLESSVAGKTSEAVKPTSTVSSIKQQAKVIAPKSNRYETRFMLALSASPLVAPPESMPALNQWYGDWEPYHFRAQHTAQSHGLPHSPMGSIGSGARAERHGRNADAHRERERNTEDADGYYGGVMRDGGLTTSRREPGGRFRNRYDEREGDMAPMRLADGGSKRFVPSGKNPFGQVSASGTFKPAGKDGSLEGQDKRFNMGRMARDRDLAGGVGAAPLDGRGGPRNGREYVAGVRDRRRGGGLEDGEDEDEWESVPKSPDNERRNRAGHVADNAMDWRRAGAGGKQQNAKGPATREREGGRKTSFPAWMAEESEPSWMSEGQEDGQYQMGGGGGGQGGGGGHEGDIDVDVSGMDGIQAFKAQMKERERRERERNQGSSSAIAAGPPPGLEKRADNDDHESKRDGMAALQSVGMNQQERSAAALFDNFASSAKQRQQEKQQQQQDYSQDQQQSPEQPGFTSEAGSGRAATVSGADNVVLPSRSSRFARFFDGKPQAAALAAQQKQMGGSGPDQSPLSTIKQASQPRDNGSNVMADLFKGLSTESSEAKEPSGPASPPGLNRNPSEADVQSMQKIMALLGGGAAANKGQEDRGQDTAYARGATTGPPPGLTSGGGAAPSQAERASPPLHQGGQQAHSPTSPYRHAPPPPPQHAAQGSWANAVANSGQPFDPRLGPFGGSPPGPGQQGPPFRPPFGMDPRLLSRGAPPPQGIPPQFAGSMNGMPPMGRGPPGNFGMPPFGPGVRPPPPPPLPPQLQQHMMNLPPQAQHQLLMQHFQHHAATAPPYGGPPQQQQQPHHLASPGLQHGSGGHSPLPPFLSPSPASSNANQSAQLMALLGQGPGGASNLQ